MKLKIQQRPWSAERLMLEAARLGKSFDKEKLTQHSKHDPVVVQNNNNNKEV